MGINPMQIYGNWDEGWVMDKHIIDSIFMGYDDLGHERFDNIRSDLGEQIYQLKYQKQKNAIDEIIRLISPFLDNWDKLDEIDLIMPAPPSDKSRRYQPVFEIVQAIANYAGVGYVFDVLEKTSNEQAKNMDRFQKKDIRGSIVETRRATNPHNILIIDDLFDTGSTLNECVKILKEDKNINKIYVLTMTKTRG